MNTNFLDLDDFSADELEAILESSLKLKSESSSAKPLEGKYLGLIFEKPSTRTRVSFEVAMSQLGGNASFLSINDLQLGRGEPVKDTARVLSSMADGLVLRTLEHKTIVEFANNSCVPVINGLSDRSHPCQLLADILTFYELRGSIKGKKVAWFGDFNNVCFSYAQAADIFEFEFWVACPEEFYPDTNYKFKNTIFTESVSDAAKNSDLISTDVWVSMGDEKEAEKRIKAFSNYQVNKQILDTAKTDVLFLHCLPAIRGSEISSTLLEDPRSYVWAQAENRLHAQKGLLLKLLSDS
tara:strand:+ start:11283 stop:12170 length:888 start_codon:yes stop_codon:yes gene_type:complete